MTFRIDSLRVRLVGVNPSRAPVIARLLAAELATAAPGLTAGPGANGISRIENVAVSPLRAHAMDTDAALASRLAHGVSAQVRAETRRAPGRGDKT